MTPKLTIVISTLSLQLAISNPSKEQLDKPFSEDLELEMTDLGGSW